MNILKQSNQEVISYLGGVQIKTKGRKYRMNKYCMEVPVEEGRVIHNYFTGAEVMIRPFEYINIYTDDPCDYAEFLVKNYFLVPEDFDEESLVNIMRERQQLPIIPGYLDHPNKFVILTTTRCNARCFYCYEMNSKNKTHMTIETAEKIAKYIMEVTPKDKLVELNWFGGEPLYNMDVIDIITSRIGSAGFKYKSSMISNCYLFDEKAVQKAVNHWQLTNVQVTFDGTESVYNNIKNYIYKDGESPYYKVIENVKTLLKYGINVSARLNCDHHNAENLEELIKELNHHFKEYGNFSIYVWPLFEIGFTRSSEEKEILYNSVTKLEKMLIDYGYPIGHRAHNGIKGRHCMVDSGDSVVIYPRGDIGMCEHYIDRNFISHIDNPYEKDMNIVKSWRNYVEYTELCKDCPIYPICLKMKGCPDEVPCEKFQKNYWIEHYKLDMISSYIMSKAKHCKDNKCNNKN